MDINYSKYTLGELLDARANINGDKFPDRLQLLEQELKRRNYKAEDQIPLPNGSTQEEPEVDDSLIIEFSSETSSYRRIIFISLFAAINLVILAFIYPKYFVTELSDTHQYTIIIDSIECNKEQFIDDETDELIEYFELYINSYQDTFRAMGISKKICKSLANELAVNTKILIWHIQISGR
ncbi:MAG: hypothetical protein HRU25_02405 [Psychrobium sp.]|nr:hypothetical protein [Psychrobium sp.]